MTSTPLDPSSSDPNNPSSTYTDPTFTLLNSTCLDLLLIELVPMAYRITADLAAREEEYLQPSKKQNRLSGTSNDANSGTGGPVGGGATTAGGMDEEEAREAVFHRLENLGYRVGLGIVERFVFHPQQHHLYIHPF
jgi:hypothetical protein